MPELLGLPVPGKWVTSLTDAALAQQLPDKFSRRPVALHPYGSGSSRRWLLSWVKNSGPDFEDWGWTMGNPVQTLAQKVDEHERVRLFLIEPVATGTLAAVWFIRVPNTPWLTWDWRPEIAAGDLKATVPAGHRLTCVRALNTGASKVAAIWTQDDSGAAWDWHHSLTFDQLHDLLRDTTSRLVSLDFHGSGSNLRFCAAWVANAGAGATPRTWFWFSGATEDYLRGQTEGLCSHPVELCRLGPSNLAAVINRIPGAGVPADDKLLEVKGMTTLAAYNNDAATNTQMDLGATVNVQVTNVAGAPVDIVSAGLRRGSLGGQFDGLPSSDQAPPPSPVGATTVIQTGGTVVTGPIGTSTSIEYRDILAFIDAKSTNNRRQRILRPLTVQRPSFTSHLVPALNEPVALVTWTDTADVVPMWRAGAETRWANLAGTIVNLTGDDVSIIRMDVEVVVDGEWLVEKNLPLSFHQSNWPDERGCGELNGGEGCSVITASANGTIDLGKKVLNRFVHGLDLDVDPQFKKGNVRLIVHYQRKRKCGTVMRDLPMTWREPLNVSTPVRGTFHWGNAFDHTGFDAHAWPGPRASYDIAAISGEPDGNLDVYPMADGVVIEVAEPPATQDDDNPNHWITVWHPELTLWTGYYHLDPGTLLPAAGEAVSPVTAIAKIGKSGTGDPHLHTGGHTLDVTGFGRVAPLRFANLLDDLDHAVTQMPATGVYKS